MRFSRFFIDRPIFAAVLSIVIFIAGLIAMFGLPVSEYPEVVPPSVVVRAVYPGANPRVISEAVATPLEEQINGVENMLYMSSQATSDGVLTLTVTFRVGTDVDLAQVQVQNRVSQALAAPAGRGAPARRHHGQELAQLHHGGAPPLAGQPVRYHLPPELRPAPGQGRAGADPGHRPGPGLRRRRLLHAGVARPGQGRGPRADRDRRGERHPRAERPGRRRAWSARRRCRCRWTTSSASMRAAA